MKKIIVFLTLSLMTFTVYAVNDEEKDEINIAGEESLTVTKGPDGPRDIAGKVTKTKGQVFYHENNSVRSKRLKKEPHDLYVSDIVRTKKDSKAFLTLTDNSKLVLDENSIIHFNGVKQISAEKGIVLFDIKKQGDLKGLKITTKTAVIGIKGTQFIIDTNSNSLKLYMKEGLVNVEAINEGTFEHHIKDKQSYKDYLKDMFTSFSEYKQKQQEEFVEFVKSIDVPENKAISINGNILEDIPIPDHIQEQFKLLDELTSNDSGSTLETNSPEVKTEKKDPFDDEIFKK